MANYCSNSVCFIGDEQAVSDVRELFRNIQQKQSASHQYHLPDFITADKGYMEDIDANFDPIVYETRWVPNLEVLVQLAEHYGLDFIAEYAEPMEGLYGEAVYTGGDLHLAYLNIHLESPAPHKGLALVRELRDSLLGGQQLDR